MKNMGIQYISLGGQITVCPKLLLLFFGKATSTKNPVCKPKYFLGILKSPFTYVPINQSRLISEMLRLNNFTDT